MNTTRACNVNSAQISEEPMLAPDPAGWHCVDYSVQNWEQAVRFEIAPENSILKEFINTKLIILWNLETESNRHVWDNYVFMYLQSDFKLRKRHYYKLLLYLLYFL